MKLRQTTIKISMCVAVVMLMACDIEESNVSASETALKAPKLLKVNTLIGHKDVVTDANFSNDGMRVVTASLDKTAKIWETNSGKELWTLSGHLHGVYSAKFTSDDEKLLTVTSFNAYVWRARDGLLLFKLSHMHKSGDPEPLVNAAFSSDGKKILAIFLFVVIIYDGDNGQELFRLKHDFGRVKNASFSTDGSKIVSAGDDGNLIVWNTKTAQRLLTLHVLTSSAGGRMGLGRSVFFSYDGSKILANSGIDNRVIVLDAHSGKKLLELQLDGLIFTAIFSPDGQKIATISRRDHEKEMRIEFKIWEVATGARLHDATFGAGEIDFAVFSPNNKEILTPFSLKNVAKLWDASNGKELFSLIGHAAPLTRSNFSSVASNVVTASIDKTAKIWFLSSSQS